MTDSSSDLAPYDPTMDPVMLKSVSGQDFLDFMKEKNISSTCIMCGSEVGVTENRQVETYPAAISAALPPTTESMVFHYEFRTKCTNCGNLQHYDRGDVLRWKIGKAR